MPRDCILFKHPSPRRKLNEKLEKDGSKPWRGMRARTCIIFAVFGLLVSLYGSASAYYFPPVPSKHIIINETSISVALTPPTSTVFINVTNYDSKQIVKNITIELCEPVTFLSFRLKVLSKKPSYVSPLDNSTNLKYYAITFSTGATNEIATVKMDFAIKKNAMQRTNTSEETLVLYRFDGQDMLACAMDKVAEDDDFLYFETNTEGSSYVVAIGGISSPWLTVVIIVAVALVAMTAIYSYRRSKLTRLRKMLGIRYGK